MTHRVHVLAHRGASKAERENTVEAFRRAAKMGSDAVELDVRRTPDGRLLVHHNPLPDVVPPYVPSLSEALDACAEMWVNVEIKNDPDEPDFDPDELIADATIELLQARGEAQRWLISSFRMETIDRCRALAPEIATAWLTSTIPDRVADLLVRKGHRALHPWVRTVTRELIDDCHDAGVEVNTWTCDDPTRMAELIGWGIDGICTNVPDVALHVLGRSAG